MSVSIEDVKKLRAKTSAGLGLCKEALEESDGDMKKAVDYVNERSDVIGRLYNLTGAKIGHCKLALEEADNDFEKAVELIKERGWDKEIEDECGTKEGVIGVYLHGVNHKVVGLVEVFCDTDFVAKNEDFRELAHNLAMQVAAMKAVYVDKESVPEEVVEEQRELIKKMDDVKNKPDDVVDKIVDGKMNKFYQEKCLLEQQYIKDKDQKVGDILDQAISTLGEKLSVGRIYRMELGR